jgi:serine-type D-Ala-D-Ala carboxypeptidase (penicillin-binding protein 5/6)
VYDFANLDNCSSEYGEGSRNGRSRNIKTPKSPLKKLKNGKFKKKKDKSSSKKQFDVRILKFPAVSCRKWCLVDFDSGETLCGLNITK